MDKKDTRQGKGKGAVQVHGKFPGSSMDDLTCERMALTHVAPDLLDKEAGLFRTKWFDYRRLHPTMATCLFAEAYRKAYGDTIIRYFDHRDTGRTGLSQSNIFKLKKGELTGLWKARQAADQYGIPYPIYVRAAIEHAMDNWFSRVPRPTQLYSPEAAAAAADEWLGELEARLVVAKDPWYRLESYIGHPDQDAYQEWLLARIAQRGCPEFTLARVLYQEPMVSEERARAKFERTGVMARALQFFQEESVTTDYNK